MDRGKNWDILLIGITFALTTLPSRFFVDPNTASRVYEWCQGIALGLWMSHLIFTVPDYKINRRSIIAAAVIWQAFDLISYWPWYFYGGKIPWWMLSLLLFLIFGGLVAYNYYRVYDMKNDEYDPDNVFILLWRPTKVQSVFYSLIGMPVGSIVICAGGYLWSFKWKRNGFIKRIVRVRAAKKKYVFIDTKKETTPEILEELESLVNKRARVAGYRCRCVYIIKNVLSMIGKEYAPHGLEYIPSLYAMKVMKLKNE